jgi:uncharacterized protein (TIGR02145 family)
VRCLKDTCSSYSAVSVSIIATANPVNSGTQVTFTATPVNGGQTPVYQWKVNGIIAGTNAPAHTYEPVNNDIITCTLISNAGCVTGNPAISNAITMIVNAVSVPCPGIPTILYQGKTYNTLQIGNQCWLKENLNAGTMISGSSDQSDNSILEKYCYNNLESNCDLYGGLYQWAEAVQYYNGATNVTSWSPVPSREITGICPTGWHLPSDGDWNNMIATLGGIEVAGGKMKESGLLHWVSPNTGASNISGFTALPGGYRFTSGTFHSSGYSARSWASNEFSGSASWFEQLVYNDDNIVANNISKLYGHSVRCLKDTCASYSTVSVSISASANPVLSGTQVTITATPDNGGTNPVYKWLIGTDTVAVTGPVLTYAPANNDVIKCVMTSNATCINGPVAISNSITMIVSSVLPCPGIPTVIYGGKTYNTVQIGTQCWFKENLDIGSRINGAVQQSDNGVLEKYCYQDIDADCAVYGGMYQWNEMMQYNTLSNQGICPGGWHVPAWDEWYTLSTFLGTGTGGGKMKEEGFAHWLAPNAGATNSSGFTALPAGLIYPSKVYDELTMDTYLWSSTDGGASVQHITLRYTDENIQTYSNDKSFGFSVRCLKDTCTSYSTVSVSINASANPVTAGTQVTFTATALNGGANPGYQWNVNGGNVGSGSGIYTYSPSNNDVVFCVVTSPLPCTSGNPATSNAITMQVAAAGASCPGVAQISYGGQTYNTVQIGEQCWLRENLNIGTRIDNFLDQTNNGIPEKYCYDDLESNCEVYGGLYQWAELVEYLNGATNLTSWDPVPAGNVQGLCPNGWHIPSNGEWTQIANYLDGAEVAGGKMKETGEAHWMSPNTDATNSSGFTALGCGHRAPEGGFIVFNQYTNYWSSTEYSTIAAWSRALGYVAGALWTDADYYKTKGFSVRCVKNNP